MRLPEVTAPFTCGRILAEARWATGSVDRPPILVRNPQRKTQGTLTDLIACVAGPPEPDLGYDGFEMDDDGSYIEVAHPLSRSVKVEVIPASPNSSWLNIVFDESGEAAGAATKPATDATPRGE